MAVSEARRALLEARALYGADGCPGIPLVMVWRLGAQDDCAALAEMTDALREQNPEWQDVLHIVVPSTVGRLDGTTITDLDRIPAEWRPVVGSICKVVARPCPPEPAPPAAPAQEPQRGPGAPIATDPLPPTTDAPIAAPCPPRPAPSPVLAERRGFQLLPGGRVDGQTVTFYLRDGLEYVRIVSEADRHNAPDRPATVADRERWPDSYAAFLSVEARRQAEWRHPPEAPPPADNPRPEGA